MVVALLIGLKYKREIKQLPAIIIDLYRIYKYVKGFATSVILLTDISSDESIYNLRGPVSRCEVETDIIGFIPAAMRAGELVEYKDRYTLLAALQKLCHYSGHSVGQLICYYSGHGLNGNLVLPNNQLLSCLDLKQIALNNLPSSSQMLWILDCCNATNLALPFYLKENVYRLTAKNGRSYPRAEIICIASTTIHQDSIVTKDGSAFTSAIVAELQRGNRDLRQILQIINGKESKVQQYLQSYAGADINKYQQIAQIYSSRPNIYLLWPWVTGKKCFQVRYDSLSGCLKLTKYEKQHNDVPDLIGSCPANNSIKTISLK